MTPVSWQDRSGTADDCTLPVAGRPALIVAPSACDTCTAGMTIAGFVPPICVAGPGALLTMTTAPAPAFCAFCVFCWNSQLPRSMIAIEPAGMVNGSQPSVGEAPAPSLTSANAPEMPATGGAGPKSAPAAG